MKKNKRVVILGAILCVIFGITFSIGVFSNPNFNIYDFCMNLSSEIIGMLIVLLVVDSYVKEKTK